MKKYYKKLLTNNYEWIVLLALVIVFIALYYKSFTFGFLSDDFDNLWDYKNFINPLTGNRWMPIQGGLYWLINLLHLAPIYIRIFFMVVQLINIFLVFKIINLITKNKFISLTATFIYTFFYRMPMVIVWIPGFLEVSVAFFFLLSMFFFLLSLKSKNKLYYFLSITIFILAILSKESSITLPIFLLLIETLIFNKFKKTKIKYFIFRYLPFLAIIIAYILITYFTGTHTNGLITRGGYNLLSFNTGLSNYANILLGFLPIKINQIIITQFWQTIVLLAFLYTILILLFVSKKISRIIPLFLSIVLFGVIPQAFFSPAGAQDRHPYLFFLAFSGLVAYLLWKLINKMSFKTQLIFMIIFCCLWIFLSLSIISERLKEWNTADQIVKVSQQSIEPFCQSLNPESIIYLVNFPQFVGNQVYVFNNGLSNMVKTTCQKEEIKRLETIFNNSPVDLFLRNSLETHKIENNHIILAFEDGEVKNYSNKYKYFENFLHKSYSPLDLKEKLSSIKESYTWTQNPGDKFNLLQENDTIVMQYTLSPKGWNLITYRNIPMIPGTSEFSIDVLGDAQNEILYFQFIDKETGGYYIFQRKIDWSGWNNLKFKYSSGKLEGGDLSFSDIDDLNIALGSDQDVSGQIKLKNFWEH